MPTFPCPLRKALTDEFFKTVDRRRSEWQGKVDQINEELAALRRSIDRQGELCAAQPKKFAKEDAEAGRDDAAKRVCAQYDIWLGQESSYGEYVRVLRNLLALRKESFNPSAIKIGEVIARRAMGERSNIHDLQNYVVGVAQSGLVLNPDGSLDMKNSFVHIDYFSLLHAVTVRNNVQADVVNRPIDLIAVRIPSELVKQLIMRGNHADVVGS